MAKVNIEEIIDHLSSEMRRSLRDSVNSVIPGATFDERELLDDLRERYVESAVHGKTYPTGMLILNSN